MIKLALISFLASTTILAAPAPLKLVWDANSPDEDIQCYCVYERISTNWVKIATVQTNEYLLTGFDDKLHVFSVTASNIIGESPFSDTARKPAVAQPPKGNRIERVK